MDSEYNAKFSEMKKYIPFLENMIKTLERVGTGDENPRQAQLMKIKSLKLLLQDNSKKMKMDNLLKCEQVLINLYAKIEKSECLPEVDKKEPTQPSTSIPQSVRDKLKHVTQLNDVSTEVKCVTTPTPVNEEPVLFYRRPKKPETSPKNTAKRQYTRLLVSPEPDEKELIQSPNDDNGDGVLYHRRRPRSRKRSRKTKDDIPNDEEINITLNIPKKSLSSLNTDDILQRIIRCSGDDVDIEQLSKIRNHIIQELKQTGVTEDISDIILSSYGKKKEDEVVNKEIEEGELSDSESEFIEKIYGNLIIELKNDSKERTEQPSTSEYFSSRPSDTSEQDARKIKITLVPQDAQAVIKPLEDPKDNMGHLKQVVSSETIVGSNSVDSTPVETQKNNLDKETKSEKVDTSDATVQHIKNKDISSDEMSVVNTANFYVPINSQNTDKPCSPKDNNNLTANQESQITQIDVGNDTVDKPEDPNKNDQSKDQNIPFITEKEQAVSEIDILKALKNDILNVIPIPSTPTTPPLHQPKVTKVTDKSAIAEVTTKKRITLEKYKEKSSSSSIKVPLLISKKQGRGLTEKECDRFNFFSDINTYDLSSDEDRDKNSENVFKDDIIEEDDTSAENIISVTDSSPEPNTSSTTEQKSDELIIIGDDVKKSDKEEDQISENKPPITNIVNPIEDVMKSPKPQSIPVVSGISKVVDPKESVNKKEKSETNSETDNNIFRDPRGKKVCDPTVKPSNVHNSRLRYKTYSGTPPFNNDKYRPRQPQRHNFVNNVSNISDCPSPYFNQSNISPPRFPHRLGYQPGNPYEQFDGPPFHSFDYDSPVIPIQQFCGNEFSRTPNHTFGPDIEDNMLGRSDVASNLYYGGPSSSMPHDFCNVDESRRNFRHDQEYYQSDQFRSYESPTHSFDIESSYAYDDNRFRRGNSHVRTYEYETSYNKNSYCNRDPRRESSLDPPMCSPNNRRLSLERQLAPNKSSQNRSFHIDTSANRTFHSDIKTDQKKWQNKQFNNRRINNTKNDRGNVALPIKKNESPTSDARVCSDLNSGTQNNCKDTKQEQNNKSDCVESNVKKHIDKVQTERTTDVTNKPSETITEQKVPANIKDPKNKNVQCRNENQNKNNREKVVKTSPIKYKPKKLTPMTRFKNNQFKVDRRQIGKNFGIVYTSDNIAKGKVLNPASCVKNYKIPKIKRVEEDKKDKVIDDVKDDTTNVTVKEKSSGNEVPCNKNSEELPASNEISNLVENKQVPSEDIVTNVVPVKEINESRESEKDTILKPLEHETSPDDVDKPIYTKTRRRNAIISESESNSEVDVSIEATSKDTSFDNNDIPFSRDLDVFNDSDDKQGGMIDNLIAHLDEDLGNSKLDVDLKDDYLNSGENISLNEDFNLSLLDESIKCDNLIINDDITDVIKENKTKTDELLTRSSKDLNEATVDAGDLVLSFTSVDSNQTKPGESPSETTTVAADSLTCSRPEEMEPTNKSIKPNESHATKTDICTEQKDLNVEDDTVSTSNIGNAESVPQVTQPVVVDTEYVSGEVTTSETITQNNEINHLTGDSSTTQKCPPKDVSLLNSDSLPDSTNELPAESDLSSTMQKGDTAEQNVNTNDLEDNMASTSQNTMDTLGNLLCVLQDHSRIKELLGLLSEKTAKNEKLKRTLEKLTEIVSDDKVDVGDDRPNVTQSSSENSKDENQHDDDTSNKTNKETEKVRETEQENEPKLDVGTNNSNEIFHEPPVAVASESKDGGEEVVKKVLTKRKCVTKKKNLRKTIGTKNTRKCVPGPVINEYRSEKTRRRGRNKELESLQEDLKEMFMYIQPMNPTGLRMCRLAKLVSENNMANQIHETDDKKEEENNTTKKGEEIQRKKRTLKLTKQKLIDVKSSQTQKTDVEEINKIPKYKPGPKSKKMEVVTQTNEDPYAFEPDILPETEGNDEQRILSASEEHEQSINFEKHVKTKRKRTSWSLGIISKKSKKAKVLDVTPTNVSDEPNESDFIACFTDKSYCFNKNIRNYSCKLCTYSGTEIVKHYKQNHPHYEVPLARINQKTAKDAIKQSSVTDFKNLQNVITKKHVCRFCFEVFEKKTSNLESFFLHIVTMHTGEYFEECTECTDKSNCPVSLDIPRPPENNCGILLAFICDECNYTQMSLQNLKTHVALRHDNEETAVYAISIGDLTQKAINKLTAPPPADTSKETTPRTLRSSRRTRNPSTSTAEADPSEACSDDETLSTLKSLKTDKAPVAKSNLKSKITFESDDTDRDSKFIKQEEMDDKESNKKILIAAEPVTKNKDKCSIENLYTEPHFRICHGSNGKNEYICCINGAVVHYKTSLLISMKKHVQVKHKEIWDGYCFMCKVIVTTQGTHYFNDCLAHFLDKHLDEFPAYTLPEEAALIPQDAEVPSPAVTPPPHSFLSVTEKSVNIKLSPVTTPTDNKKEIESPASPLKKFIKVRHLRDLMPNPNMHKEETPSSVFPRIESVMSLHVEADTPETEKDYPEINSNLQSVMQNSNSAINDEVIQHSIISEKHHIVIQSMLQPEKLVQLFKCAGHYCSFTSNIPEVAVTHMAEHERLGGSGALRCTYCQFSENDSINLVTHILKKHGGCQYSCKLCFYRAATVTCVESHLKRLHPGANLVGSVLCSAILSQEQTIDQSHLSQMNAVPLYLCAQDDLNCNFRHYISSKLTEHYQLRHKNDSLFNCSFCDKKFEKPAILIQHLQNHGLNVYHCSWCVYGAETTQAIVDHISAKHPEKNKIFAYYRRITVDSKMIPLIHINRQPVEPVTIKLDHGKETPLKDVERALLLENLIGASQNIIGKGSSNVEREQAPPASAEHATPTLSKEPTFECSENTDNIICLESDEEDTKVGILETQQNLLDQTSEAAISKTLSSVQSPEKTRTFALFDLFKCGNCHMQMNSSIGYKRHTDHCAGMHDGIFKCGHCPHTETEKDLMVKHYVTVHSEVLKCEYCFYENVDPNDMQKHMQHVHGKTVTLQKNTKTVLSKVGSQQSDTPASNNSILKLRKPAEVMNSTATSTSVQKDIPDSNNSAKQILPTQETRSATTLTAVQKDVPDSNNTVRQIVVPNKLISATTLTGVQMDLDSNNSVVRLRIPTQDMDSATASTDQVLEQRNPTQNLSIAAIFTRNNMTLKKDAQTHATSKGTSISPQQTDSATQNLSDMVLRQRPTTISKPTMTPEKDNSPSSYKVLRKRTSSSTPSKATNSSSLPTKMASTKVISSLIRYGPSDINSLPINPILEENVYCALCEFYTKVRLNMVRHLQQHANQVPVASTAPVNPVPHLDTNEKHFDKMTNLASSSMSSKTDKQNKGEPQGLSIPNKIAGYPQFVPERKRWACGAADCSYISVDEVMLKYHWDTLHLNRANYRCVHCSHNHELVGRTTPSTSPRIISHLRMHDSRLYGCSSCNYYHFQRALVENHIKRKHDANTATVLTIREPSVPSPVASASTSNTPTMDLKPWHCGLCPFKNMLRPEVVDHCFQVHNSKCQYNCAFCDYRNIDLQTVLDHHSLAHPGRNSDVIHYFYREGSPVEDKDTPLWKRQRELLQKHNVELPCEVKVDLGIVKFEVDVENDMNLSNLKAAFGEFCEPKGGKFVCPLCVTFVDESRDVMICHLYEELNYRKWGCNYCPYKGFHKLGLLEHTKAEHISSKVQEPKPLPLDHKKEMWVKELLDYQVKSMSEPKDNISEANESLDDVVNTISFDGYSVKVLVEELGSLGTVSDNQYTCPKCGHKVKDEAAAIEHLKSEISNIRWACSLCSTKFAAYNEAQAHTRTVHYGTQGGTAARVIVASLDDKVSSAWVTAVVQTQKHAMDSVPASEAAMPLDETTMPLDETTQLDSSSNTELNDTLSDEDDEDDERRLVIDTGGVRSYGCTFCGYIGKTAHSLSTHMYRHYNLKPYKCSHCNYNNYTQAVHKHISVCHPNEKCLIVKAKLPEGPPMRLQLPSRGKKPADTATGTVKYVCLICEEITSNKREHMNNKHKDANKFDQFLFQDDVAYACGVCVTLYKNLGKYKEHWLATHPNEPLNFRMFKLSYGSNNFALCQFCRRKFKYYHELRVHIEAAHSNRKHKMQPDNPVDAPSTSEFSAKRQKMSPVKLTVKKTARKSVTKLP